MLLVLLLSWQLVLVVMLQVLLLQVVPILMGDCCDKSRQVCLLRLQLYRLLLVSQRLLHQVRREKLLLSLLLLLRVHQMREMLSLLLLLVHQVREMLLLSEM